MRLRRVGVALGSLALAVAALEAGGRLLGVDYELKARAFRRLPIYYQQPTLRDGPFLRRRGPAEWRGRAQTEACRQLGFPAADLGDRPVVARYDRDGFRNPPGLTDWEVVVCGDSFVEAGYLPEDELLTAVLARRLGRRVKNLGLSYTATLGQTWFLRRFGRAPATRDAVVAFYEGNDLDDLAREAARAAAPPDPSAPADLLDGLPRQSSLARAAWELATKRRPPPPARSTDELLNADFVGGAGAAIPMTIGPAPPAVDGLDAAARERLDGALAGWAAACKELGLAPWLLYLPCKRRALDGRLRFRPGAEGLAAWRPDGLPAWVEARCRAAGVRFVDATPALQAAAARGVLPYNAVWDAHLSADGHEVVGGVLAAALGGR